jgi:hypothetical protein
MNRWGYQVIVLFQRESFERWESGLGAPDQTPNDAARLKYQYARQDALPGTGTG